MATWNDAVVTYKGLALQAKLIQGTTLTITKVVIGAGYVSPVLLIQQTAVSQPQKTLSAVSAVSYPEEGKCALQINVTNDDVTTAYTAKQIGFYATDPDDGEILYCIAQVDSSSGGTYIPSKTEMPGYSAEWTFYMQYGNADDVTVTVDPSNTVSVATMEAYVEQQTADLLNKSGGTMTGDLTMSGGKIKTNQTGIQFDGINKYAVLNDQEFFPAGKTILQYANDCAVSTSVMIVQDNYPTDAPAQVEAHLVVMVGTGGRKTVVFMPFNNAIIPTFARDIFNSAWNENNWRPTGGFAQETAEDLHTITECKTVQCYSNTLNTPFKEGLTNAAHGVCIVAATGNFRSLVYIATSSSAPIWYQACVDGTWGRWVRVSYAGVFKDNAIYVGPTGNDTTGDGTQAKPYASLAKALSVIPKDLGGQTITINVAAGTYTETGVNITDFYGGQLSIVGDSTTPPTFTNRIYCMYCSARISFKYINTVAPVDWGGFSVSRCAMVEFNDCNVNATTQGKGFGIYSAFLSEVYVHNCEINNCQYGVSCAWGKLFVSTATGSGNTYGAHAGYGGQIGIANSVPGYATAQYVTYNGGRIYKDGQTNVPKY